MKPIRALKNKPSVVLVLCFLLLLVCRMPVYSLGEIPSPTPTPTPTPTPEPTPVDPELAALKKRTALLEEEKKAAEAEKAIAEAKKAELAAKFPKPTTTPLEGKTEVDANVKIESEMMAYIAMAVAANKIVEEIKAYPNSNRFQRIAVYNEKDVKTMIGYNVTTNQLVLMHREYKSLLTSPESRRKSAVNRQFAVSGIVAGVTAASSILGSFIDLLSFFRTDTSVKGMEFKIGESALVSEVFRSFKDPDNRFPAELQLYYPLQFPPQISGDKEYIILGRVEELYYLKARAERIIAEIEEAEKKLGEAKEKQKTQAAALSELNDALEKAEARLLRLAQARRRHPRNYEVEKDYIAALEQKEDLVKQRVETLAAQEKNNKAITDLEAKLEQLYENIEVPALPHQVTSAVIEAEGKLNEENPLLGRKYGETEKRTYIIEGKFNDNQKKNLLESAKNKKNDSLTAEEVQQILEPLAPGQKTALKKIRQKEESLRKSNLLSPGELLPDVEIIATLTEGEKAELVQSSETITNLEEAVARKLKEASVARLKTLNSRFNKFYDDLTKVDEVIGTNAITSYLLAEDLKRGLGCDLQTTTCDSGYFLQLAVLNSGGNVRVKKNLITNVFTGADITHSGGTIVEYKLYDVNGIVLASNAFTVYEHYRKPKTITRLSNQ